MQKNFKEDPLRGYENEARKRLYHEYEPLRLEFCRLCDRALKRIYGLARNARDGSLPLWLSHKDSYYLLSTVYTLFLPIAYFRIMQSRLTLYDLRLVPSFRDEYLLITHLYSTFSQDFVLSAMNPAIRYDQYRSEDPNSLNRMNPDTLQQGVYMGSIDEIADSFIRVR